MIESMGNIASFAWSFVWMMVALGFACVAMIVVITIIIVLGGSLLTEIRSLIESWKGKG